MRRLLPLFGLVLLVLPATAEAALPAAKTPPRSVAGVKITWPLTAAETSLAPGSSLAVAVRSSHRRAQLALLRVDGRGRAIRSVARKTLRSGTFSIALPATAGARYRLALEVAGKRYWSWITTPVALPAAPAPVVVPAPPADCGGYWACDPVCVRLSGPPQAVVTVTPAQVPAGEIVTARIQNVGPTCLASPNTSVGQCITYQRPDGTVEELPLCRYLSGQAFTLVALPGGERSVSFRIPADTAPGLYTFRTYFGSADFEVVPAA